MEPWIVTLVLQTVIQLIGLAILGGVMWNKLARAAVISESNQELLMAIRVAMATAKAQADDVIMHVGDLEIRVRRLESQR